MKCSLPITCLYLFYQVFSVTHAVCSRVQSKTCQYYANCHVNKNSKDKLLSRSWSAHQLDCLFLLLAIYCSN